VIVGIDVAKERHHAFFRHRHRASAAQTTAL
jgi:hypothetical protein